MWKWFLRIFCLIVPVAGFFIAIGLWLFKKPDLADEVLFFSFAGIFVFIVVIIPLILLLRFVIFPY